MKIAVQALADDADHKLGLALLAGRAGLSRVIDNPRIQKPGLAIAGLIEAIRPGRVQVLGNTEMLYLQSLDATHQEAALGGLFQDHVPCIVVTQGLKTPPTLSHLAEREALAVFATPLSSGVFIARVHAFFDEHLSPRVTMHGVLVDVFGVGVLLSGQSGIGKSECGLDLILRGHRLVADDVVIVRQRDRELLATGSPLTRHHMEVRGLGIINVKDLFGAASVCEQKQVSLIVDMVEWRREGEYDRLGLDDTAQQILGIKVPQIRLPIMPGRNVASIVEVAARNFLLQEQGHHAARELEERVVKHLAAQAHVPKLLSGQKDRL